MSKATIIGAGVMGASIAYELSCAGIDVTLVEQRQIASGASGVSAAMLEAQLDSPESGPFHDLAFASRQLFPDLARRLQAETGMDIGYDNCGIVRLAASVKERQEYRQRFEWQKAQGLSVEWWDDALAKKKLAGIVWDHDQGAIFYKDDGQVIGSRFTAALVEAARKRGATIIENAPVDGFDIDGQLVRGLRTQQGRLEIEHLIIASGPWSRPLAERLNFKIPMEPVRGQILRFATPRRFLPCAVYLQGKYFVPKPDGTLLFGSTLESVGFDDRTTGEVIESLKTFAFRVFPELRHCEYLGAAAGLRPGPLPDHLPAIGPLPNWNNVWLATGHFRNGVLLAPITAQMIKASITATPFPIEPQPFAPARFS